MEGRIEEDREGEREGVRDVGDERREEDREERMNRRERERERNEKRQDCHFCHLYLNFLNFEYRLGATLSGGRHLIGRKIIK